MDPLVIDLYESDLATPVVDWSQLFSAGAPWDANTGVIMKATQGTYYAPRWFGDNWNALKDAAGDRFGNDFKRGAYHFLDLTQDGAQQASFFKSFVEKAGGFDSSDWPVFVDVEHTAANNRASKQQVIDCVSAFAAEFDECILYGGTMMFDLGITDHMGCSKLWTARYAPTLPENHYTRIGWDRSELFAWQYCGAGSGGRVEGGGLDGYPYTTPLGVLDISALQDGSLGGVGGFNLNPALAVAAGAVAVTLAVLAATGKTGDLV